MIHDSASPQEAFCYYILLCIITHYCMPEGSSLISQQNETTAHSSATGSACHCPSIWTDRVKRSFNRPYHTLSGLSTNRSTPGWRVKTKSSRLNPYYFLSGNGQHCRRWCPSSRLVWCDQSAMCRKC